MCEILKRPKAKVLQFLCWPLIANVRFGVGGTGALGRIHQGKAAGRCEAAARSESVCTTGVLHTLLAGWGLPALIETVSFSCWISSSMHSVHNDKFVSCFPVSLSLLSLPLSVHTFLCACHSAKFDATWCLMIISMCWSMLASMYDNVFQAWTLLIRMQSYFR